MANLPNHLTPLWRIPKTSVADPYQLSREGWSVYLSAGTQSVPLQLSQISAWVPSLGCELPQ